MQGNVVCFEIGPRYFLIRATVAHLFWITPMQSRVAAEAFASFSALVPQSAVAAERFAAFGFRPQAEVALESFAPFDSAGGDRGDQFAADGLHLVSNTDVADVDRMHSQFDRRLSNAKRAAQKARSEREQWKKRCNRAKASEQRKDVQIVSLKQEISTIVRPGQRFFHGRKLRSCVREKVLVTLMKSGGTASLRATSALAAGGQLAPGTLRHWEIETASMLTAEFRSFNLDNEHRFLDPSEGGFAVSCTLPSLQG